MRTIIFRGQTLSGEWICGSLIRRQNVDYIGGYVITPPTMQDPGGDTIWIEENVVRETVGMFTGLIAGKRKTNLTPEVYEGDIFRSANEDNGVQYNVVIWLAQRAAFYMVNVAHYSVLKDNDVAGEEEFDWLFEQAALYDFSIDCGLTKVGNIHDNKELLK